VSGVKLFASVAKKEEMEIGWESTLQIVYDIIQIAHDCLLAEGSFPSRQSDKIDEIDLFSIFFIQFASPRRRETLLGCENEICLKCEKFSFVERRGRREQSRNPTSFFPPLPSDHKN
jgi:hypothetical protein